MSGRDPDEQHRSSTPLELLFDLTFVVAVAQAGAQLHHGLAAGNIGHALAGYAAVFFGIWWAWVNFTWFASAYDTDDVPYRLLTLLQMGGVLVLAAGIPSVFEHFDFAMLVVGYAIMRLALVAQWLRASTENPENRSATVRYALGVAGVQGCWVGWLWLTGLTGLIVFAVLIVAELAVPAWAEFGGGSTPWHPDHITERYGLFTIIVLGEVLAATMTALQQALTAGHADAAALITASVAGLLLVFGLWWSYFQHLSPRQVRRSLRVTFAWGYAHYAVFASVAALGAGMQVVIDSLSHHTSASPTFAALTIAIPVVTYLVVLNWVVSVGSRGGLLARTLSVCVGAAVIVVTALSARTLTLPASVLVIALLVAMMIALRPTATKPG